jgi:hypothetical protein
MINPREGVTTLRPIDWIGTGNGRCETTADQEGARQSCRKRTYDDQEEEEAQAIPCRIKNRDYEQEGS